MKEMKDGNTNLFLKRKTKQEERTLIDFGNA